MFPKNPEYEKNYSKQMKEIKEKNRQKILEDYRTRLNLYLMDETLLSTPIDSGFIDIEIDQSDKNPITENLPINYFSKERIAVYTAIFGAYDEIVEPVTVPDNCDFYIFTDQEVPRDSVWEKISVDLEEYQLTDKNNLMKNRYFKMHPHLFFEDYNYSLYIDGNIKLMTDPTEFIDRMNKYGVLFHNHYRVDCAYVETERCRVQGLGTDEEYDQHLAYLREVGLPRDYGFLECPVIFREHYNEQSKALMSEWWEALNQHAKRDQINLTAVLYKRGIRPEELAGLGNDLYSNYAFQKVNHKMSREDYVKYNGEIST
jgi:hypothetical protein